MKTTGLLLGALAGLLCCGSIIEASASSVAQEAHASINSDAGEAFAPPKNEFVSNVQALVNKVKSGKEPNTTESHNAAMELVTWCSEGADRTPATWISRYTDKLIDKQKNDVWRSLLCGLVTNIMKQETGSFEWSGKYGMTPDTLARHATVAKQCADQLLAFLGLQHNGSAPCIVGVLYYGAWEKYEKYGEHSQYWKK